jgi:peptidoglycan/xylan/chitin deacetylase (PgdA/CDA1 family)
VSTGPTDRRRLLLAAATTAAIVVVVLLALTGSGSPDRSPTPDPGASGAGVKTPSALREALLRDDAAIDDVLGYAPFIALGAARHKEVALTFDDGPGPTTLALLRYLKTDAVPATFFLVGRSIAQHTGIVRYEAQLGFSLGTHTESHMRLASRPIGDQQQEILTTADRITRVSRHAVRLFRPPYGSYDAHTMTVLRNERMLMVLWSVDPADYDATAPAQVVAATLKAVKPGAIVLLHDGPGPRAITLAALRLLVPALRRRGYKLVSVPELLRDDPPPRRQPHPRGEGR